MLLLFPFTLLVFFFTCVVHVQGEEAETLWKPHVKIVTKYTRPFIFEQDGIYRGFIPDLIELIFKDANITRELYLVPDNHFGSLHADGKWDGLMGEVVDGPADMAVGPLTITENRMLYVEFSFPFMHASVVPIIHKPKDQGAPLPFDGLNELLEKAKQGQLSYGVLKGGATEQLLKDGKYKVYKEMHDEMLSKVTGTHSPFVSSYPEAYDRLRNDSSFVFFGDDAPLEFVAGRPPCDLKVWGNPLNTGFYGIAFKRSVPQKFLDFVNARLVEASFSGELTQLRNTWWQNACRKEKLCVCHGNGTSQH